MSWSRLTTDRIEFERDIVGPVTFKALQKTAKLLHLGGDLARALSVIGRGGSGEQRRRGRRNPLRLSRDFLQGQRRGDAPGSDAIKRVADLAEGEQRDAGTDDGESADPEKRQ